MRRNGSPKLCFSCWYLQDRASGACHRPIIPSYTHQPLHSVSYYDICVTLSACCWDRLCREEERRRDNFISEKVGTELWGVWLGQTISVLYFPALHLNSCSVEIVVVVSIDFTKLSWWCPLSTAHQSMARTRPQPHHPHPSLRVWRSGKWWCLVLVLEMDWQIFAFKNIQVWGSFSECCFPPTAGTIFR